MPPEITIHILLQTCLLQLFLNNLRCKLLILLQQQTIKGMLIYAYMLPPFPEPNNIVNKKSHPKSFFAFSGWLHYVKLQVHKSPLVIRIFVLFFSMLLHLINITCIGYTIDTKHSYFFLPFYWYIYWFHNKICV